MTELKYNFLTNTFSETYFKYEKSESGFTVCIGQDQKVFIEFKHLNSVYFDSDSARLLVLDFDKPRHEKLLVDTCIAKLDMDLKIISDRLQALKQRCS